MNEVAIVNVQSVRRIMLMHNMLHTQIHIDIKRHGYTPDNNPVASGIKDIPLFRVFKCNLTALNPLGTIKVLRVNVYERGRHLNRTEFFFSEKFLWKIYIYFLHFLLFFFQYKMEATHDVRSYHFFDTIPKLIKEYPPPKLYDDLTLLVLHLDTKKRRELEINYNVKHCASVFRLIATLRERGVTADDLFAFLMTLGVPVDALETLTTKITLDCVILNKLQIDSLNVPTMAQDFDIPPTRPWGIFEVLSERKFLASSVMIYLARTAKLTYSDIISCFRTAVVPPKVSIIRPNDYYRFFGLTKKRWDEMHLLIFKTPLPALCDFFYWKNAFDNFVTETPVEMYALLKPLELGWVMELINIPLIFTKVSDFVPHIHTHVCDKLATYYRIEYTSGILDLMYDIQGLGTTADDLFNVLLSFDVSPKALAYLKTTRLLDCATLNEDHIRACRMPNLCRDFKIEQMPPRAALQCLESKKTPVAKLMLYMWKSQSRASWLILDCFHIYPHGGTSNRPYPGSNTLSIAIEIDDDDIDPKPQTPSKKRKRIPESRDEIETDVDSCIICYEKPRSCVFIDCGHQQTCVACTRTLLEKSEKCPTCRFNNPTGAIYCFK